MYQYLKIMKTEQKYTYNKKLVMIINKVLIDLEEIKKRPNNYDLGEYIRQEVNNMDNKQEDKVVEIMKDWYAAMEKHGISVQPKASTILGTILNKHLNSGAEDVFDKYMNTKAGEFEAFWQSLSNDEKAYVEKRRAELRDEWYTSRGLEDHSKELLKG